jgi:glycine cleavage system aminomethyltransferase T
MKTTPFTEKHIALGAKMHEFAGNNEKVLLVKLLITSIL